MLRLLALFLIIYLFYSLFLQSLPRLLRFFLNRQFRKMGPVGGKTETQGRVTEAMVACQTCGTFVSQSQAVVQKGHSFCSEKCAQGH